MTPASMTYTLFYRRLFKPRIGLPHVCILPSWRVTFWVKGRWICQARSPKQPTPE